MGFYDVPAHQTKQPTDPGLSVVPGSLGCYNFGISCLTGTQHQGEGLGLNWGGALGRRRESYCWGLPERSRPTSLDKGSGSPRKNVWGTIERRQRHKSRFQDGDRRWRLGWEDGIREGSRIAWVG